MRSFAFLRWLPAAGLLAGSSLPGFSWGSRTANRAQAVTGAAVGHTAAALALSRDINGDGTVDVADLNLMIAAWAGTANPLTSNWNAAADLNGDGDVNVADLQILANYWDQSVPIDVTVIKDPLGDSADYSGNVVGKVYVPSRYGGQLDHQRRGC